MILCLKIIGQVLQVWDQLMRPTTINIRVEKPHYPSGDVEASWLLAWLYYTAYPIYNHRTVIVAITS